MDDTQSALKEFNFTKASQIDMSGLFDDNLNINIVPFPTESEDNEMTTIPTTTIQDMNIPNIFTSDSNNFYRDFTSAMFES
jgi:hypothetical protein